MGTPVLASAAPHLVAGLDGAAEAVLGREDGGELGAGRLAQQVRQMLGYRRGPSGW